MVRCGHCALPDTPEGHDGCLGTIPGAMNACCGHGRSKCAYIQYRRADAPDDVPGLWWCCCVDGSRPGPGVCPECGDERTFRVAGEEAIHLASSALVGGVQA